MRLDHLLSKENVRCQITDVSYSKSTSGSPDEFFTIRFTDILHLFNLQDPSRVLEEPSGGIAQLGERLPCKQEVAGSIPAVSTKQDIDPAPEENKVRL